MCVCMHITKVVIADTSQSTRFFFFPIEFLKTVQKILNLEGHQNSMIGSQVMTILTMFIVHDYLGLFWI